MIALILNSGRGTRMGALTADQPKCMTLLSSGETILQRQLRQLLESGITDIVITTGPFTEILESHAREVAPGANLIFVNNPQFAQTNYIYSIWLAQEYLKDDLVLLHGDLVFEHSVIKDLLALAHSGMVISSTAPLPEKDFKATLRNGCITAVGIEFFINAVAAQPFYKLQKLDWLRWLDEINLYIARSAVTCYAENALNQLDGACNILLCDIKDRFCVEVDNLDDLNGANSKLQLLNENGSASH